ncbi:MAG: sulfatase [Verrucomicrobiota bacterium]
MSAAPPNVILFLVDDLGWKDTGCQGSDYYKTPHIDRLAADGVRFTDFYATCALCTPTRASLLTGKYPARLLMTQWLPAGRWSPKKDRMREGRFLRSLPLEDFTLAETLREAGYQTWHVGKWHLGGPPFSLPAQHGFDVNVGGSEHGAPGSYFFPYKGKWTVPTTGQPVLKQTLPDGKEGEYLTDRLTEEAIALMRNRKEKPFFLHFAYYAVHTPLQAKKKMMSRYEAVAKADRQGKPAYAAMVESVDQSIGRVVETLEELGLAENTLILFTSDNGGFAGATNHAPLRANKGSHYEGGIRVPLIVKGSGVTDVGAVTHVPAITNDLYPTILEMAGLPLRPNQHLDGTSLAPLLKSGNPVDRLALFWHYPHYNRHPQSAPVSVMRRGRWKLIESLESGGVELFDLSQDLGETTNLAKKEVGRVARMRGELDRWRREVGAEPMRANPYYQGGEE